jgi:hypothetical protein
MKVYLIEDDVNKACFLSGILQSLNRSQSLTRLVFSDGFEKRWRIGQVGPEWVLKAPKDEMGKALGEIRNVLSDPDLLLQAAEDEDGICLIDLDLPAHEGYDDTCRQILTRLRAAGRQQEMHLYDELMGKLLNNPDLSLAAVLLAVCKHLKTKCLTISMAYPKMWSVLEWAGFKAVRFPFDPKVDNTVMLEEVVNRILASVDVISWFLQPPGIQEYPDMQWFDLSQNHKGHNPGDEFYDKHVAALSERYPRWGSDPDAAKALIHSKDFAVRPQKRYDRAFLWRYLEDFFSKIDSNLPEESLISLPIAPGLPFLVCLQRLFKELGAGRETPVLLRCMGPDVIAIGRQRAVPIHEAWELADLLWKGDDDSGGDLYKAFRQALDGKWKQEFSASPPRLAPILNGIPKVATPWITDNMVGVSWKTVVKLIPVE